MSSRLRRRGRKSLQIDLHGVREGERNKVKQSCAFPSQGRRQQTAARILSARAAEQRREKERARRAKAEIEKRQKENAAAVHGKTFDLTNELESPPRNHAVAAREMDSISEAGDSDFESDHTVPSENTTPLRASHNKVATDDVIDEFDQTNKEMGSEPAGNRCARKGRRLGNRDKLPGNQENPSVSSSDSPEVIAISSDDEPDRVLAPRVPRRDRTWAIRESAPRSTSRSFLRGKRMEYGFLPVQNNPMFSNPRRTGGSTDLLMKAKGRASELRTRDSKTQTSARPPFGDATQRQNCHRKRDGLRQGTVDGSPAPALQGKERASKRSPTGKRKERAPKRSRFGRSVWQNIIEGEQKRRRLHGVDRFNTASPVRATASVNLAEESSDTEPSARPRGGDKMDAASSGSRKASLDIGKGVCATQNERLDPLSLGERGLVRHLTSHQARRKKLALVKCANIQLCSEDFRCLRGHRWLNDEIMNSFAALINERNRNHFAENDVAPAGSPLSMHEQPARHNDKDTSALFARPRPRTHVFNSFFFTRLTTRGYDYAGVRRWPKRAGVDIAKYDLIAFPININGVHWVLAFIDMRARQFVYCDSMFGHDNHDVLATLRRWLRDEIIDKHGAHEAALLGIEEWPCFENPGYLPRQEDAGSCGVFALYTADYMELGKRPDFKQKHIPLLRQKTAIFLQKNRLPPA